MSTVTIRWLCRFGWHQWTRWSETKCGNVVNTATGQSLAVAMQDRTCLGCGKRQIRDFDA